MNLIHARRKEHSPIEPESWQLDEAVNFLE